MGHADENRGQETATSAGMQPRDAEAMAQPGARH